MCITVESAHDGCHTAESDVASLDEAGEERVRGSYEMQESKNVHSCRSEEEEEKEDPLLCPACNRLFSVEFACVLLVKGREGLKGRLWCPEYALRGCRKRTCIRADKEGCKCGDADPVGGFPPQWVSRVGIPPLSFFIPFFCGRW